MSEVGKPLPAVADLVAAIMERDAIERGYAAKVAAGLAGKIDAMKHEAKAINANRVDVRALIG